MRNSSTRGEWLAKRRWVARLPIVLLGFICLQVGKVLLHSPGFSSPTLPFPLATREENSLPKWAGKAAGFSSQIYTALTLAIWNKLEKKHGSLEMARFLLVLPMPYKYWRSSSVGDSLSLWISHSFCGPEQGSIFKSFQRSSWLWPNNTKTELLEFLHGGCLIHIGNLLFLMQPLLFFFFFSPHEKPHEGKAGPRKKLVTKSKGLGLTWDKIRSWKEPKLTRGRRV